MAVTSKKHWSSVVLESIVSKTDNPDDAEIPGINISGGAENGYFPYFSNVNQSQIQYESGKVYLNDILLEINGQTVAGLTLYDLKTIINCATNPLKFKHVRECNGIQKDLRKYLSKRFEKGSIDCNLQALIRDNLYLRTLP